MSSIGSNARIPTVRRTISSISASWLALFVLVACGESSTDAKKQETVTDAGLDGVVLGAGGSIAEAGGQTAAGGTSGQLGSGGASAGGATFGAGGTSVLGAGGASTGGAGADSGPSSGSTDGGSDAGTCASDGDCKAPTRFCDVTQGVCVECLSDNHCPTGQTCSLTDHVCKYACTTSADCKDPRPYCDTRRSECVECLSDTNCSTGTKRVCESKTRTCVECAANGDCLCLLPGQVPCCTATNVCTCGLLICI